MTIYAASDLHLGLPAVARMFHDDRQGHLLEQLCQRIAREQGELILVGDVFDLTALTPPAKGLAEFARATNTPIEVSEPRQLGALLEVVREANPVVMQSLEWLSARAPVTFIPGNHDRHLGEPGGREALDAAGLKNVRLEPLAVRSLAGRVVVFEHGHAWDPGNATPTGGGEVMTSVLHHAVVPFLRHMAPRRNVRVDPDRVVSLRPEERVIPVLERWVRPGDFETFLDAFLALLVANGAVSHVAAWFATPERIRHRLKDDDDLWERSGHTALKALGGEAPIPGNPPPPDVLVLGHTHVLDWAVHEGRPGAQRLYVNLGTWTDRAADAAGPTDLTLPVLEVKQQEGQLTAVLRDAGEHERELQRFEAAG